MAMLGLVLASDNFRPRPDSEGHRPLRFLRGSSEDAGKDYMVSKDGDNILRIRNDYGYRALTFTLSIPGRTSEVNWFSTNTETNTSSRKSGLLKLLRVIDSIRPN